jgi:hypothetical protein
MAVDETHPNVVRFDGKLWVSEVSSEQLMPQLTAQRAWDNANDKANRWWLALGIGGLAGVIVGWWLSATLGAPPVMNLFTLPVAFATGAVLGARVNEKLRPSRAADQALGERPHASLMVRLPRHVARSADATATATELIRLSTPKAKQ